jgi:MOSC domain-containing protein YiiM
MRTNEPTVPPGARTGRVVAVCAGEKGLAKRSLEEVRVTRIGVPGDVHHGETRATPAGRVPNDRPITAIAVEATSAACAGLGIPPVPPGGFGENLLLEGLGDLGDLAPGDLLRIGADGRDASVVLVVSEQNQPCRNLCSWHPGMRDAMLGRRGVILAVRREGTARPGDRVEVVRAAAATGSPP